MGVVGDGFKEGTWYYWVLWMIMGLWGLWGGGVKVVLYWGYKLIKSC